MAQINLLKQKSVSQNVWYRLPTMLARILMLVALGVLLYYGWLFLKQGNLTKEIANVQQKITDGQKEALGFKEKDELFTRQAQLKELGKLVSKHSYFSQLLPELAKVTLKKATYTSIKSTLDGDVFLTVIVPDIWELDKFMQVFDSPRFYENFSEVRVGALHKIQQENKIAFKVELKMKYNMKLLKYANKEF